MLSPTQSLPAEIPAQNALVWPTHLKPTSPIETINTKNHSVILCLCTVLILWPLQNDFFNETRVPIGSYTQQEMQHRNQWGENVQGSNHILIRVECWSEICHCHSNGENRVKPPRPCRRTALHFSRISSLDSGWWFHNLAPLSVLYRFWQFTESFGQIWDSSQPFNAILHPNHIPFINCWATFCTLYIRIY